MMQSIYSARSGLVAQQQQMDIIANNIANISTTGFKAVRADFKDALYQAMVRPVQPRDNLNLQRGHGTLLGATKRDFVQGTSQLTGNPLDFMLDGDGFFTVQGADGEVAYTRDGSFRISIEGDGAYLVTADGRFVLDADGQPINLGTTSVDKIAVTQDGVIYNTETNTQIGQFGIVTFLNRQGLMALSGNRFGPSENSGEPIESDAKVRQGALEASNVDLAGEMVNMIRAQRAFSLISRALTTADQMDSEANQIRR